MSAITPTDVHRDDIDADWEEVARERKALSEFRDAIDHDDPEVVERRWEGVMAVYAGTHALRVARMQQVAWELLKEKGLR